MSRRNSIPEVNDPAIKLFGRSISFPEVRAPPPENEDFEDTTDLPPPPTSDSSVSLSLSLSLSISFLIVVMEFSSYLNVFQEQHTLIILLLNDLDKRIFLVKFQFVIVVVLFVCPDDIFAC